MENWVYDERSSSYTQFSMLESIPEADLFLRGKYPWMNQNPLSAYFHANTSAHYLWARGEIRKNLK